MGPTLELHKISLYLAFLIWKSWRARYGIRIQALWIHFLMLNLWSRHLFLPYCIQIIYVIFCPLRSVLKRNKSKPYWLITSYYYHSGHLLSLQEAVYNLMIKSVSNGNILEKRIKTFDAIEDSRLLQFNDKWGQKERIGAAGAHILVTWIKTWAEIKFWPTIETKTLEQDGIKCSACHCWKTLLYLISSASLIQVPRGDATLLIFL